MNSIPIHINLTEKLKTILSKNGVNSNDYRPAYDGESVGLDLYNASDKTYLIDDISLPRMSRPSNHFTYNGTDLLTGENQSKILIPSGVKIALPKGYVALLRERGSIIKTKLVARAGVIDPGYTDEIFVNLYGKGEIQPGAKLPVQLIVVKAETNFQSVSDEDYEKLTNKSNRKDGKVGSSD